MSAVGCTFCDMDTEPLKALGVATERVGQPRNDGTRGSGLYMVPIRLSRIPTTREAQLVVHHWDNPSAWSTMHRHGIARVERDLLILDGTTIEEVRDQHTDMIRRVIAATNADEATAKAKDQRDREAATQRAAAHEENVRDVAGSISFD